MNPGTPGDDDIAAQHLDEDLIERFVACVALLRLMDAWAARANKAWGQVLPFRGRSLVQKEEGA